MLKSKFSIIKQALKGENHDYTQGNLSEAVILLAIPMILELGLESVFAVVDMFFVSKLGPNAIATVGLTEAALTILYSIAIGLSTGASAVVARRIGEKNPQAAAHAGAQSLILAILLSIILGIFGVIFAKDILILMGASAEVVSEGAIFTQIMLGGDCVVLLLFLINGIFRGAGDAAMAMKSLWMASGTNIILCPIMIHFFGLKGAAFATVIGRGTGICYQCYHLFKGKGVIQIHKDAFKFDFTIIKSIMSIAWPASWQFIIGSGSWIILTRLVAEIGGTAASAGYQIAIRNFVFFILPAWGISNAAATLVGQNLGANLVDRAEQSVYITAKYCAMLMAGVTLFFTLFSAPIIRLFSIDPIVVEHGITALQILGSGYVFYGIAMVMTQALNGAGETKIPTWINFICFWVFQIPFAYFLAKGLELGPKGAMMSVPIAQILVAFLAWYYFRQGKWKTTKI
jgi:putative MATE family efflux protein